MCSINGTKYRKKYLFIHRGVIIQHFIFFHLGEIETIAKMEESDTEGMSNMFVV